jgi:hypothetical protein
VLRQERCQHRHARGQRPFGGRDQVQRRAG